MPVELTKVGTGLIRKTVGQVFPNGTKVITKKWAANRIGIHSIPGYQTVTRKEVYLSEKNPLYKAGLRGFFRDVAMNGNVHFVALGPAGEHVAIGISKVKELILAMKKFGLTLNK